MRALIVDNKEFGDKQADKLLPDALSDVAEVEIINYQDDGLEAKLRDLRSKCGFAVLSQVPITYAFETARTPERRASVQRVIASGVPIFAICIGFQGLGDGMGGDLRKGEEPEVNREITVRVFKPVVIEPVSIFDGLGESFPAQTNHRASLDLARSELTITATSDDCEVQAARHPTMPYDGVQFHPEESEAEVRDTIFRNIAAKAKQYYLTTAA